MRLVRYPCNVVMQGRYLQYTIIIFFKMEVVLLLTQNAYSPLKGTFINDQCLVIDSSKYGKLADL